jgi:hypothetical protein
MSISTVLILVALLLAFLDVVLWNAVAAYNRVLLTPVAVVLLAIALLIGSASIHMGG